MEKTKQIASAGVRAVGARLWLTSVAVAAVVTGVLASGGEAFATCSGSYCGNGGDSVDVGFGSMATTILGYLGDAVALVIAVVALGLGIRMLVKWIHRAVAST